MVNEGRLAETFSSLVKIDSVSREEGKIARVLTGILEELGASVAFDNAGKALGGDVGNLIATFEGNVPGDPIMLCGHMDTVEPGRGITPILKDGVFTSDGTTILGADDKSALAIIIEVMRVLKENKLPHGPIEVVFTICEELGLLGAKHFDFSLLSSKFGYILDSTIKNSIVTKAPRSCAFEISVHGKDAHAGISPENGVNAIAVASLAISKLHIGRIDDVTTMNIGKIEGGVAKNIVPSLAKITGEARSHNEEKLDQVLGEVKKAFEDAAEAFRKTSPDPSFPKIEMTVELEFPKTDIAEDHPVVVLAKAASKKLGEEMVSLTTGGGADANVFFENGVETGVLCPGMTDPHTLRESVKLSDMVFSASLLLEIINMHTNGEGKKSA